MPRKVVTRKPRTAPDAWPWLNKPAGVDEAFCGYREHRPTDWRRRAAEGRPAGKWTCGRCHPPPEGVDEAMIERRSNMRPPADTARQSVA